MREKLNTLPLSELKELAKARKLKGFSNLRKAELIDLLCQSVEQEEKTSERFNEGPSEMEDAQKGREAEAAAVNEKPAQEEQSEEKWSDEQKSAVQRTDEQKPAVQRTDEQKSAVQRTGEQKSIVQRTDEQRTSGQKTDVYRTDEQKQDRQRTDGQRMNDKNTDRNDTGRMNRNRQEGKGRRVVSRFENQNSYQNRSRSQDNNRNQDNGRSQDNNRNQDNGRNQDNNRNQDNSRNQDNNRSQDNGRSQDNSRSQDNNRSQDYSRGQDNARGQDGSAFQDGGRSQESVQNQDIRPVDINQDEILELDSGMEANGILEVMPDGFGFIRCENFLPGDNDVYVAPSQIRRFNMKTGDIIRGNRRVKTAAEKFAALLYVTSINGYPVGVAEKRPNFEDLTPIFPDERIHMETSGKSTMAMRVLDLMAPIGKGQRGMIVSPPKAGKTTLLKQVAKAITANQPDMHLIILLIDERPEEVTDIKEAIVGSNVEVIYSTFDELPERHKRVSEMVIERARRLVEHGRDVTILLDSITRLARAYNLVVPPSGRTLSGGLDPAALHMPKRFFGAARNMREGGSLTILATALIDTGSRMDDVIYEEFKGTGNMELVLDRKLSERRIFPAIDILKSGTRRDDLLLSREESEAMEIIRRATNAMKPEESVEKLMDLFSKTRNNQELVAEIRRRRYL